MKCKGCNGDGQVDGEILRFDDSLNRWLCADCQDTAIDHKNLTQRYLIHYDAGFGPRFGVQVWGTVRQAREDRDLFASDGFPARIVELTVVDGQPVAQWVQ